MLRSRGTVQAAASPERTDESPVTNKQRRRGKLPRNKAECSMFHSCSPHSEFKRHILRITKSHYGSNCSTCLHRSKSHQGRCFIVANKLVAIDRHTLTLLVLCYRSCKLLLDIHHLNCTVDVSY
ncbi:uncharacterized protein V6R79_004506 [Siganus canaliculatus]